MKILSKNDLTFPHPSTADKHGAVAIGGNLSVDRLLLAYQYGYFPWYNPRDPIIWWHPDPRFVIFPEDIRVTKSMRPYFNQEKWQLTFDKDFDQVITACEQVKRKNDPGTWITNDIKTAYGKLHELGLAHSIEVWDGEELIGGLYGVSLGKVFFGESMFSKVSNASKFALISLSKILEKNDFMVIDCQMPNSHLKSMGGRYISRDFFLSMLRKNIYIDNIIGDWNEKLNTIPVREMLK